MGFLQKLFGSEDKDEAELDAARARHGITVDKTEIDKPKTEAERFGENFDIWDDLKNYRMNFFFGGWMTKKFRPINEDKVRKELEELDKKRKAEEERKKMGEG